MKKLTMKDIAKELSKQDIDFEEHLSPLELSRFTDKKLSKAEEDKVFDHLSKCSRCVDVLQLANELEEEDRKVKPVNNPDYKGTLKHFLPFAAAAVIFLGVPQGDKYLNSDASVKSVMMKKNIFEESVSFWKKVYEKLLIIKDNR